MAKKNVSVSYKVVNHDSAESEEETQSDSPPSENLIMDNSSYRRKASAKRVTSGSSVAVITDVFGDFSISSPKWLAIICGVVLLVGAFVFGVLFLTGVFSGDTESESDYSLCMMKEGSAEYKVPANKEECEEVKRQCDEMDEEDKKDADKCTWTMLAADGAAADDEPAAEPAADVAPTDKLSTPEEAE